MSFSSNSYIFYSLIALLCLSACQSKQQEQAPQTQTEVVAKPKVNEEDLLLRLSALMTADTSLKGRQLNQLLNYAIDNSLDVQQTPSGLLYYIEKQGEDEPILWGDFLKAHYKGYFLDGKVFADSQKKGKTLDFYVGNMIDAWNEGLQLLKVGGKMLLLVPSDLAYGPEGLKTANERVLVPSNTPLVFEMEILEKLQLDN